MTYQNLGESDLNVSTISFGCMSLGIDDKANTKLLHTALDLGINFFDTADLYQKGQNEVFVGNALKDRRQEVILATKVGNQLRPDGSGWDWNPSKAYIKKAVLDSLRRLQTDYIDLYQLHGGTIDDPIEETVEAFEELQKDGHIRYYGISSIRPNVIREYLDKSNIVSIMMQYSLLDRRPEESCLDLIHQKRRGVIVRGGLAKGLLAGKPAREYLSHNQDEVAQIQQMMKSESGPDRTSGQTALKYCLQHPAIATLACGISREEQLRENVATMYKKDLSEAQIERLKTGIIADRYDKHR